MIKQRKVKVPRNWIQQVQYLSSKHSIQRIEKIEEKKNQKKMAPKAFSN